MTNPLREVVADALPELLPCPFCGATRPGIALHSTLADRCFRVLCICGAEGGPWGKRDDEEWGTYEEAIAAWNRRATLPTQSAGVEERAREIALDLYDWMVGLMPNGDMLNAAVVCDFAGARNFTNALTKRLAAALRTPASEGDGGRVVEWQIMRPAFVTADENYSGKRVAAVYADASMIGQRVHIIPAASIDNTSKQAAGEAVELEQFRPAVVNWRNEQRGTIKILSESLSPLGAGAQKLAEGRLKEAERLLAVIDTPPTQQEARASDGAR